jgi:hypothetical protein
LFLAISGFTNDQCFLENGPLTEFLAHSAEILSKVPIGGKSGLSKVDRVDRAFRHRAKRAVLASRSDPHHVIVLQEHKVKKLLFYKRH